MLFSLGLQYIVVFAVSAYIYTMHTCTFTVYRHATRLSVFIIEYSDDGRLSFIHTLVLWTKVQPSCGVSGRAINRILVGNKKKSFQTYLYTITYLKYIIHFKSISNYIRRERFKTDNSWTYKFVRFIQGIYCLILDKHTVVIVDVNTPRVRPTCECLPTKVGQR